jgi:GntR family transcriptional regulator, frlABCD operon transcriptional regulator
MNYIFLNQLDTEPLYRQLKSSIKKAILTGHLNHQDSLPSEHELSTMFSISSTVVKKAYYALEQEQLIQRIQGKGTFVFYPNPVQLPAPFQYFFQGDPFQTITTAIIDLTMNPFLKQLFPKEQRLLLIKQLLMHDALIVGYQETILPFNDRQTFMSIHPQKFCLKNYVKNHLFYQTPFSLIHQQTMTEAEPELAKLLHVTSGHPLHLIHTNFSNNGERLAMGKTYLLGDRVAFSVEHHL